MLNPSNTVLHFYKGTVSYVGATEWANSWIRTWILGMITADPLVCHPGSSSADCACVSRVCKLLPGNEDDGRDAGLKFSGSARFNKLKRKGSEVLDYKCRRNAVLDYFWQWDTGASTVECRHAGHLDGLKPYILGGIIEDVEKWCFKPPRFPFFSGDMLPVPLANGTGFWARDRDNYGG